MTELTDSHALAEFAKTRSSDAFTVLVERYIDLIYSAARRMTRDAHLAEDVTQAVFIVLARRAKKIDPKYLAGWLVNTTRLASRDALRSRNRRHKHEAEAAQMRSEIQSGNDATVEQMSPLLDDALARLSELDR
jgi:RNA polymerase sigma factor (sigma-70 family)